MELIRTYCAHCHSRCGVICQVEDGVFKKVQADAEHPNGMLCIKGEAAPELVYSPDRLRYPMKRTRPKGEAAPGWQRISWEEALDTIAFNLNSIKEKYGPEAVVFSKAAVAGSPVGDIVFWWNRLGHAFGSPNFLTSTHTCQWHRDAGSRYTYGTEILTPDFDNTACILIWGVNPPDTYPTYGQWIRKARKRGARLIVVDPRRTSLAREADIWLGVRPGTDGALALGMINVMVTEQLYDEDFVCNWTNGPFLVRTDTGEFLRPRDLDSSADGKGFVMWDEKRGAIYYDPEKAVSELGVQPALAATCQVKLAEGKILVCKSAFQLLTELVAEYSPKQTEAITWVEAEKVREAARMFALTRPACYYTYVGIEEHTNSMQTNRAICILYALTGNYDAPGGNVQFPRAPVNPINGLEFLPEEKAKLRLGRKERPLGPCGGSPGSIQSYDVYNAILSGKPYPVKALLGFGGDVLLSNADSGKGRDALRQLEFYAHADLFETPASSLADILLPAASCWESEHVRPYFEGDLASSCYLQLRKEVVPSLYESWPDMKIIFTLANKLGLGNKFWQGDVEAGYNYQLSPSGITVEQLKNKPGGIHLSVPLVYKKYSQKDPQTGRAKGFNTPTRKMEIYSATFLKHGYDPLPRYREPDLGPVSSPDLAKEYPLVLTMCKLHQFCHTQHRNIPSLRKQMPYPFIEMHPQKAQELGLTDGDWVMLETATGGAIKLKLKLSQELEPRVVCTQHGWWQACPSLGLPGYDPFSSQGANANLVISDEFIDPISGSVPHRSYLCRVRGAEG